MLILLSLRYVYLRLGGIQQLRGQNFAIFWPPPLRGQFLYPEHGQKQTFFDPLPPHLVHVIIEWSLWITLCNCDQKIIFIRLTNVIPFLAKLTLWSRIFGHLVWCYGKWCRLEPIPILIWLLTNILSFCVTKNDFRGPQIVLR